MTHKVELTEQDQEFIDVFKEKVRLRKENEKLKETLKYIEEKIYIFLTADISTGDLIDGVDGLRDVAVSALKEGEDNDKLQEEIT